MVRAELGIKRLCESCGAKYYDLNNDPITCPKCGTVFVIEEETNISPETMSDDVKPKTDHVVDIDDDDEDDMGADIISLEDVDEGDDSDIPDDIPDFEDDDINTPEDDDTFLETDDDDDDMSDIIHAPVKSDDDL